MGKYIIKKLSIGILLIFSVSILTFSMLYMMPGDPVSIMAGPFVQTQDIERLSHEMGLDRPLIVQYGEWLKNLIIHHDFGRSYKYSVDVWSLIKTRVPISARLTFTTLLIETLVAVPLGLLCAYKKDSLFERLTVGTTLIFAALPTFWLAVILMLVFSVKLRWLPLSGYETWQNYVLPIAVGVIGGLASTIRLTRSECLDVMNEKYVATAYAKGLSKRAVMIRHVLRNSLIVVAVNIFLSIPWLVSGYIVIERIFGIPGMGALFISSITQQDIAVIQAIVLIISTLTVICNVLSDIVLGILDPRIRISVSGGEQ